MRSRTELVTTTLADSENEDDPSLDDSEEDWKPEKKSGRGGAKVTPKSSKRKSSGSKTRSAKKAKKEESSEEEDPDDDPEEEDEEDEEDEDYDDSEDGSARGGNKSDSKSPKKARTVTSLGKNQPDKDGNMELYLFKNDLTKDYRNDPKLCMWRRDGASLLQKYIVVKPDPDEKELIFNASSVYSCWEEKRKNDFFQIKVTVVGDKKDGKVKVIDLPELEKFATEERPKVDVTPRGNDGDNADNAAGDDAEEDDEGEDAFEEEE